MEGIDISTKNFRRRDNIHYRSIKELIASAQINSAFDKNSEHDENKDVDLDLDDEDNNNYRTNNNDNCRHQV